MKHDVTITLRLDSGGYDVLKSRAKKRGVLLSEYLRRLIAAGLSLEAGLDADETKQNLRQSGRQQNRYDTTTIGNDEIEYRPESETQRRVRETLESKGLGGKREPAKRGIRYRADGNPY